MWNGLGYQRLERLLLILPGLGLFGGIAENVVRNGSTVRLDVEIDQLLEVSQIRQPFNSGLHLISLAGTELIFVVSLPLVAYLVWRQRWRECGLLLLAVGGGETASLLLKMLFTRQKTMSAEPLDTLSDSMFPSGHAMMSFIFYGLITYVIVRRVISWRWRALIVTTTTSVVLLIGFSQLVVGGHYMSDVLAGYAAGLVWLVLTIMCGEMIHG